MAAGGNNGRINKRDFSFLNGNSVNLSLIGKRKGRMPNLGRQQRAYVTAPVARTFRGLSAKADITTQNNGNTSVKHSEYIRDVLGSFDFNAEEFQINPGNGELFPWLANIAKRYESYQFRGLQFRFEPTAPTSVSGSVIVSVDYNPESQAPVNKVEALSMESAVRTTPWSRVVHTSLGHNLSKRKSYYVRNSDEDEDIEDPDLYDTGKLLVMTQGVTPDVTGSVGEMYVDYHVDLITPLLETKISGQNSAKLETKTPVGSANDSRFLFDEDIIWTPPSMADCYKVGPGINVPDGFANVIGAIEFKKVGNYLLNFSVSDPSAVNPLDPATFIAAVPGPSAFIDWVNLTPGGGTIMVNAARNHGMAEYAVRVKKVPALFGLGSTTGLLTAAWETTTRLSGYSYTNL